jgi:hypothetical protein
VKIEKIEKSHIEKNVYIFQIVKKWLANFKDFFEINALMVQNLSIT